MFGLSKDRTANVIQPKLVFEDPIHREIARTTYDVIKQCERLASSAELKTSKVQEEIVRKVREILPLPLQASFAEFVRQPDIADTVERLPTKFVEMTIYIPGIILEPKDDSPWIYREFTLNTSSLNLQSRFPKPFFFKAGKQTYKSVWPILEVCRPK